MEIVNTVGYISSCTGIYTVGEIFYLVFEYVFILAMLLVSHYIGHLSVTKFYQSEN